MKASSICIIPLQLSIASTLCSAFTNPSTKARSFIKLQASTKNVFRSRSTKSNNNVIDDKTFIPPNPADDFNISDPDCISAASKLRRIIVPVPTSVSTTGEVGLSYIHWPKAKVENKNINLLPIILMHGFDSSSLEYRRLGPQLSSLGVDVYAIDLLGWGYTQLDDNIINYSAESKVKAVASFWNTIGNNEPVAVCGASLGGAAAIEYATLDSGDDETTNPVKACVLLDAQGFVDGTGPVVSMLPKPLAKLGINVLKSEWLRDSANQMSYFDKDTYATEDALKVGRMHCMQDGWEDSLLGFMSSGGFKPKNKVPLVTQQTCIIWGRNDGILNGEEFANKFMETLPNEKNQLNWIEECGHVPHLEQPKETAKVIYNFLNGVEYDNASSVEEKDGSVTANALVVGVAAAASTAAIIAASTL